MRIRVCLLFVLAGVSASAQRTNTIRPEFHPMAGAFLPAGQMHRDFEPSVTAGVQGTLELLDAVDGAVSVSWIDGRSRTDVYGDRFAAWTFDAGLEFNSKQQVDVQTYMRPFLGAGVGARIYDFEHRRNSAWPVAYASVGVERVILDVAYRIETRAYVSGFGDAATGHRETRGDFAAMAGIALRPW